MSGKARGLGRQAEAISVITVYLEMPISWFETSLYSIALCLCRRHAFITVLKVACVAAMHYSTQK